MVYPIGKWAVYLIHSPWIRKVHGLENVPKDKPFIIAANHSSYFETLLLYAIIIKKINKQMHAFTNSIYWDNPATKIIINWGKCIPVFVEKEKDSKRKNQITFEKALSYIKKGEIIEIFPEGRRNNGVKLGKAYNGIARLALKAKVPVLPIGIIDSHKILPKGKIFPRFARCEVKIGKPMYFEKYYSKKNNAAVLDEVTRCIMKEIGRLIAQEYNY